MIKVSDEEFIATFRKIGTYGGTAKALGLEMQNVKKRCRNLEKKYDISLQSLSPKSPNAPKITIPPNKARLAIEIDNGVVIAFSDAHFWPGEKTPANVALLKLIRELKPVVIFCNGDAFDGARVSRWPRIG